MIYCGCPFNYRHQCLTLVPLTQVYHPVKLFHNSMGPQDILVGGSINQGIGEINKEITTGRTRNKGKPVGKGAHRKDKRSKGGYGQEKG